MTVRRDEQREHERGYDCEPPTSWKCPDCGAVWATSGWETVIEDPANDQA